MQNSRPDPESVMGRPADVVSGARVSAGGGEGEDLIDAVKKMRKREREAFLEDLPAAMSPDYLKSIQEARADEQAGRVKTHAKVFGGKSARFKT